MNNCGRLPTFRAGRLQAPRKSSGAAEWMPPGSGLLLSLHIYNNVYAAAGLDFGFPEEILGESFVDKESMCNFAAGLSFGIK